MHEHGFICFFYCRQKEKKQKTTRRRGNKTGVVEAVSASDIYIPTSLFRREEVLVERTNRAEKNEATEYLVAIPSGVVGAVYSNVFFFFLIII